MPSDEYCMERLVTYTEYVKGRMRALWGRGWGRANVTYIIYVLLTAPECLEWALRDKRVRKGLTPSRLAYCRRVASRLADNKNCTSRLKDYTGED
jgi:hypothetical protein